MAFNIEELQLPHRVDVQTLSVTRDSAGGVSESWTTVKRNLVCLISQTGGRRDGRFEGDLNTWTGTVVGGSSYLARSDVRLYVRVGPQQGRYLRILGGHQSGPVEGVVDAFYRASVEDVT